MELLVWRTKRSWTNAAVSSSSDELELSTDEENPPAENVASPIHNASSDEENPPAEIVASPIHNA
eukprot:CAMPEP_0182494572 /NCGR_PEP_ID=MMETSP1321-20130603/3443_1 /TAXON_ID=91990 /ORGANISM="Bolidomonas sp., Strain RCC1657" /LENGTH=64 /DNA_ID=CAMNT_0024697701 /DNA_START=18 /DNA_END=209 /DNA_ORIENTATION=-